jgi:hypothetical protein
MFLCTKRKQALHPLPLAAFLRTEKKKNRSKLIIKLFQLLFFSKNKKNKAEEEKTDGKK